jgi:hypothetical protein
MQNARLAELEKLLAKTSAQPSPRIKSSEMTSSEEMNTLKQEIRVVSFLSFFASGERIIAFELTASFPPLCSSLKQWM